MNERIDKLIQKLRAEAGLYLTISLGGFLFILFFQPFPLNNLDFNNGLVYVAGFAGIIFVSIVLVRAVLPWLFREKGNEEDDRILYPTYLKGFLILLTGTLAFAFYLRYVGSVRINFFISLKVILICLVPPVILGLYDKIKKLTQQNDSLILEKKIIQKQVEQFEEDYLNKSIEFLSENINENFTLPVAEVAFIRSADNYVEVVYKEGDSFKKRLIRNTLKNIELQIRQYSIFIRCHRICIVNVHYIEKLTRQNENHWLIIKGFNEQLPVSRQYLLKLKETL